MGPEGHCYLSAYGALPLANVAKPFGLDDKRQSALAANIRMALDIAPLSRKMIIPVGLDTS